MAGAEVLLKGRVVKSFGKFYTVEAGDATYICQVRGKLKHLGSQVLAGDEVLFSVTGNGTGNIESVLPRRTVLDRPPVANISKAVVVFSLKDPPLNEVVVDRLLISAENVGVDVVLCLNKRDLITEQELSEACTKYRKIGYRIVAVSAKTGYGLDELMPELKGRLCVLAGQSGVGKSTLLNKIKPGLRLRTGDISPKLRRGTHTTRHVELIKLDEDTYVADSPGFNYLELPPIRPELLDSCFIEMRPFLGQCRFKDCRHKGEPGCEVKNALQQGTITLERYKQYLRFLEELENRERL